MQDAANGRIGFFGRAAAALVPLATLAAAALPAGARADGLTVPHAAPGATVVAPQAASPSASPAPRVSSPPAQPAPPPPPPSLPPIRSGSTGGSTADPEYTLPGAGVPAGDGEEPYPAELPSPFGGGCDLGCLETFHEWYFERVQVVRPEDPEAADALWEELNAVDEVIRNAGGDPWDPEHLSDSMDRVAGRSGGSDVPPDSFQQTSPSQSANPAPTAGSVLGDVVDAISEASALFNPDGSRVVFDQGTYELQVGWIDDFLSGVTNALFGSDGTTACAKTETVDGKVPYCPN